MGKHRHAVAALAFYALLAQVAFRPLFWRWNDLPTYAAGSVPAMAVADRNLNVWILGWVAHALLTDPARLFDGNILHPAPDTLAGSENMLAHVPVTVPVQWLTGNAAHVLKAMMLESIVLTALAGYLLVRHHTGDAAAALVAGTLLTLSPWRFEPRGVAFGVAAEPQYLGFQYLPLAMLAGAIWLERRSRLAWLGLAAAVAMQTLASFYLGYVTFAVLPAYLAALVVVLPGPAGAAPRGAAAFARRALPLAGALLAGAVAVLPAGLPYLRLRGAGVVPAYDIDFVARLSAPPWQYLEWSGLRLVGPLAALATIALGVVRLARWRGGGAAASPGARAGEIAAWVLLATGLLLAWGPYQELPGGWRLPLPFALLWRFVPGFSAMRGAGRFVVVLSLACSLLAGHALAAARGSLGRARWAVAALAIAVATAVVSARPVPTEGSGLGADAPAVYRFLAGRPPGEALLELPAKAGEDDLFGLTVDSQAMLASTVHWQPLLNGYTAYEAPSRYVLAQIAHRLPSPDALERLLALVDVRWVLVHRSRLWPAQRAAFDGATPGLAERLRDGDDVLYEVVARPPAAARRPLLGRVDAPESLEGAPRRPLPAACRVGGLSVALPEVVRHRFAKERLEARIENRGDCPWPALGAGSAGLVMLEYRWLDGDRAVVAGSPGRLGRDVPPRAAVEEPLYVLTPLPGRHRLEVTLRQQGTVEPLATWSAEVAVAGPGAAPPPGG